MAFIEPPKGRAKIIDMGEKLRIEIPLRPARLGEWLGYGFVTLFLTGWLIGWAFGEIHALRELGLLPGEGPVKSPPDADWFLGGWLIAWTAGGVFALGVWAFMWLLLIGKEVVTVSPVELNIATLPVGRMKRYRLSEIANLRVEEIGYAYGMGYQALWKRAIAFDYGASTVRFGVGLEPAEARQIVALIKERFGQYMKAEE